MDIFKLNSLLVARRYVGEIDLMILDYNKYRKLASKLLHLSSNAKKNISEKTYIYLALAAADFGDFEFLGKLTRAVDFEAFRSPAKLIVLARIAFHYGHLSAAKNQYLSAFEKSPNLLRPKDYESFIEVSKRLVDLPLCEKIFQYLLQAQPNDLKWKLQALVYQISLNHLNNQPKGAIINNLRYLYQRCELPNEYFIVSNCLYLAGSYNDFVKAMNEAFSRISANLPYDHEAEKKFSNTECLATTQEVILELESIEKKPFLIGGTLLGMVRDGELMPYDKDADLGLFVTSPSEIEEIARHLCTARANLIAPTMITDPPAAYKLNVPIYDVKRGTVVDLFFFQRENISTRVYNAIFTPLGLVKWSYRSFGLEPFVLGGFRYTVPTDCEAFLVDNFGQGWRERIPVWDSIIDCPNLSSENNKPIHYFATQRLFTALWQGRYSKALNYYHGLRGKWQFAFSEEAILSIERRLQVLETK